MIPEIMLPGAFGSKQWLTVAQRDFGEMADLIVPAETPQDAVMSSSIENEDRYIDAYWQWIHPLYPIVHRKSFNLTGATPLLKAAMLALGAQALTDAIDKTNARILHEKCIKVLKKVLNPHFVKIQSTR